MESWLPIPECPDYEVSNHGRVRSWVIPANSTRRPTTPRYLRCKPNSHLGYVIVNLRHTKQRYLYVHRLVLELFVGPCPLGMEACHEDGDRSNNHVDNLRWDTSSANNYDIIRHGRHNGNKTECIRGHANWYVNPKTGRRNCKTCRLLNRKKK